MNQITVSFLDFEIVRPAMEFVERTHPERGHCLSDIFCYGTEHADNIFCGAFIFSLELRIVRRNTGRAGILFADACHDTALGHEQQFAKVKLFGAENGSIDITAESVLCGASATGWMKIALRTSSIATGVAACCASDSLLTVLPTAAYRQA